MVLTMMATASRAMKRKFESPSLRSYIDFRNFGITLFSNHNFDYPVYSPYSPGGTNAVKKGRDDNNT